MPKIMIDDLTDELFGGGKEQLARLKRVFKGMELKDSKVGLLLTVKEEDKIGSIPHDLEHCVFANACTRLYDSRHMVFSKTIAYIDMEGEDGVRRVYRYLLGEKMRAAVVEYDASNGASFKPGVYMLRAAPWSSTLDGQRATKAKLNPEKKAGQMKRHQERKKRRRSLINSEATEIRAKTKNNAGVRGPLGIIRSGTGLVHTKIVG